MRRVFVSYSRRNKTFAERLARDLSDAGLEVWIDFRQIQGGERWRDEIQRGLEKSDFLIVALSPDALESEWVAQEVNTARQLGKQVIPVMVINALAQLEAHPTLRWLTDIQFIDFENRYEQALPELFAALPGLRPVDSFRDVDPANIPNPFKGLEAFQQTDEHLFFGREDLIKKLVTRLRDDRPQRFLAVVGASGTGKSSLVRAGMIPAVRGGKLPGSETWPIVIFAPGQHPLEALATRLLPLARKHIADASRERESTHETSAKERDEALAQMLGVLSAGEDNLDRVSNVIVRDLPPTARLLLIVDQFEEVFTHAGEVEREQFIKALVHAATVKDGRTIIVITMRADFFGYLSSYPDLAALFEQENLVIVTNMTPVQLRRAIEGPAQAVGLVYDAGLVDRILEEVRTQPGALPLLQYALKELYNRREGRRLTAAAYEAMGGVRRALAQHAEGIYTSLPSAQQDIMRRLLLRLIEVSETGEATRRRVDRAELVFRGVSNETLQEVIDLLTAPESRLLIASRRIDPSLPADAPQSIFIEVGHEALIREWNRFKEWVSADRADLRFNTELLQAAHDWLQAGRDPAYLLRGNRLTRADAWVETADASDLQREFIQASEVADRARQQAERRRQRRIVIGSIVFGIVALILAAVAFFGLTEAQRNATRADQQAARASSLALSASSRQALGDDNTDLAVALALTSVEVPLLTEIPPQAERALADSAYAPGTRRVLLGHEGAINALAINADASLALSASADHTLILWDIASGQPIRRLGTPASQQPLNLSQVTVGHTNSITAAAISPDGTRAISTSLDGVVILWNLADGTEFYRLSLSASAVAFHPNGLEVLLGQINGIISVWDVTTGQRIRDYQREHNTTVLALAFSPNGTRAVSGAQDGLVVIWDVNSGSAIHRLRGHGTNNSVYDVAINPAGTQMVSASQDETLILWDIASGQRIQQFIGHNAPVYTVEFTPDGTKLLSGGDDGSILLWNITTTQIERYFLGHEARVTSVKLFPDGKGFISGSFDRMARIWDMTNLALIRDYPPSSGRLLHITPDQDGLTAVTTTADGVIYRFNIETGEKLVEHQVNRRIRAAAYSPITGLVIANLINNQTITLDVNTGAQSTLEPTSELGHLGSITFMTISADGRSLLTASSDSSLLLWDLTTGQPVRRLGIARETSVPEIAGSAAEVGHTEAVYAAAFSPDGRIAASGGADDVIILWDLASGSELARLTGHNSSVLALSFSPDGTQLVSGGQDSDVIVWNIQGDSGILFRRLNGHTGSVNAVAFSPDGRLALSGSNDTSIRLWDVERAAELRRFAQQGTRVLTLAFNNQGDSALAGGSDRSINLWRVFPNVSDLIAWTRENRFVRDFTCQERVQYDIQPLCEAQVTYLAGD